MARMIEWVEPFGPSNEPVYLRVTEATAIAVARDVAARRGHNYESDKRALDDFICVHWAEVIEVP